MLLFCDIYKVKSGDTLYALAKKRGFDNPGPIVAFPANQSLFRTPMSPNQLAINTILHIPWHPSVLQKLVVTSEFLISETAAFATELIEQQNKNREDLEDFLVKIDALNMVAVMGVSVGTLAAEYVADNYALSSQKVVAWFLDNRAHLVAGDLAPMALAPSVPKRDFKFFVRHAFGPWTPSYWASVKVAFNTGDLDLYLYGSAAVAERNANKIKLQTQRDIERLRTKITNLRWQLGLPCYAHRI